MAICNHVLKSSTVQVFTEFTRLLTHCCCAAVSRFQDRLCMLLEEERLQRRGSWQQGLSALEEQQHQLVEAQQSAAQVQKETDPCTFINRYNNYLSCFHDDYYLTLYQGYSVTTQRVVSFRWISAGSCRSRPYG